ncbi:hypothetical protein C5S29_08440, partial [ANME-1 cluster archaeon GoMg3.2]|nr:hypothetical protein [ANME-1 cluster archaeon GoMg3.2]
NVIKNSALYAVGVKLGDLAVKLPMFKRSLEFAGKTVNKLFEKKE